MKTKRLTPAVCIIVTISGGLLYFNSPPTSPPALFFRGYDNSGANASQLAKLELRNTTGRAIWLNYSGAQFPLRPPILERPIQVSPKPTNHTGTNVYSISVGSFFMHGEKVLPGKSVCFDWPIRSGEPAKQVGVYYYFGAFSDGNDFLSHIGTPLLDNRANWKDKASFYWQRLKRRQKAAERHEIWCPDALSLQAATTNPPPKSAD